MHPLVRELYKQVMHVSQDYPHPKGVEFVRRQWKLAIRDPNNCPSCYIHGATNNINITNYTKQQESEIRKAVAKGRAMIREMIGITQLKKYRTMKKRYNP